MALTKGLKAAKALVIVLLVIIIIVTVYTILCWISDRKSRTVSNEEMDIIIVGGGTAGCVLARRLHDSHPHLKILVMERGQDKHANPRVYNPARALEVAYSAPYSVVIPVTDRVKGSPGIVASTASMVGGGSSHNFGLTVHGSHRYYQQLGEHLGLQFNDFRKIFRRIENLHSKFISEDFKDKKQHGETSKKRERGTKGLMQIGQLPVRIDKVEMIEPATRKAFGVYGALEGVRILERALDVAGHTGPLRCPDDLSDVILKAVHRTRPGAKIVIDYNLGDEACVSKYPQLFVDFDIGLRCSADVAYLDRKYLNENNSKNRKGGYVEVGQDMSVKRLLFSACKDGEKDETRCTGVEWKTPTGCVRRVHLSKRGKVILAAGGIYSPLLLQQSIRHTDGSKGYLNSKIGNGKIGQGMLNHYGCTLIFKTTSNFNFSSGPVAFVSRDRDGDLRDWQMVVGGPLLTNAATLAKVGLTFEDGNFASMLTWLMESRARGSASGSLAKPKVTLDLYGDGTLKDAKSDIRSIVDSLRWMYQVILEMRKSKLFSCSKETLDVVFPPEDVMVRDNLEELEIWAKLGLSITDHYSGTCAVGAVVDGDEFKVKGLDNVHVADASVFPIISNGNTEFPVLVIGEVAAVKIGRHL